VARIILLDSGPLGLACSPPTAPGVAPFHAWLADRLAASIRIVVPAVADYEVRREAVRLGASAKLRNLDGLGLPILELDRLDWLQAADYWAVVRRMGLPTAPDPALDADCLIAGCATVLASGVHQVTIATNNVGHFNRFPGIDARAWATIA
jgi:predicted nucleic acid-binding protein